MMFEKAEYMERLEKVKKSMSERGIDVLFISNPLLCAPGGSRGAG